MPVTHTENREVVQEPTVVDRTVDAVRHAAHLSHEARLMRSMARDAGEEGVHAAKRAIRRVQRGVEVLEDLKDETAHYVKRRPFKAVAASVGFGLLVGMAVGWTSGRLGQRRSCKGGRAPGALRDGET